MDVLHAYLELKKFFSIVQYEGCRKDNQPRGLHTITYYSGVQAPPGSKFSCQVSKISCLNEILINELYTQLLKAGIGYKIHSFVIESSSQYAFCLKKSESCDIYFYCNASHYREAKKSCTKLMFQKLQKNQTSVLKSGKSSIISVLESSTAVKDAWYHKFTHSSYKRVDPVQCMWNSETNEGKCICRKMFWDIIRSINNNFTTINEYIQMYKFADDSDLPMTHRKEILYQNSSDETSNSAPATEHGIDLTLPSAEVKHVINKQSFNFENALNDIQFWQKLIPMVIDNMQKNYVTCLQCVTKKRKTIEKADKVEEKQDPNIFYSDDDTVFDEIIAQSLKEQTLTQKEDEEKEEEKQEVKQLDLEEGEIVCD